MNKLISYILVPMYNGSYAIMPKYYYEYLKKNKYDSFDFII